MATGISIAQGEGLAQVCACHIEGGGRVANAKGLAIGGARHAQRTTEAAAACHFRIHIKLCTLPEAEAKIKRSGKAVLFLLGAVEGVGTLISRSMQWFVLVN